MISTIVYFLIALMSYLGSRKAGLSKGKSALVAAGVTGGAYLAGVGDKVEGYFSGGPSDPATATGSTPSTGGSSAPGFLDKTISWVTGNADTIAKGAAATGVVAGLAAGGSAIVKSSWFPWVLGGAVIYFVTRKGD